MLEKILKNYLNSVAPRVDMKENEKLAMKYLSKLKSNTKSIDLKRMASNE